MIEHSGARAAWYPSFTVSGDHQDRDPKDREGETEAERNLDGFRLEPPSSSDWALQTQQRALPKELLEAMKHPDVPGVVLQAIAQRSSAPPSHELEPELARDPEEDTARYVLPAVAAKDGKGPSIARVDAPASARSQHRITHEPEDSLAQAYVLGVVFGGVVLAWLSFGLLAP